MQVNAKELHKYHYRDKTGRLLYRHFTDTLLTLKTLYSSHAVKYFAS